MKIDEATADLKSERRRNPLTGDWVLVSPNRLQRPWQGAHSTVDHKPAEGPAYDQACYLCPGNSRVTGAKNPMYEGVHTFDNDFGALQVGKIPPQELDHCLFTSNEEMGTCRVICFSPHHSRTLSDLGPADLTALVDVWTSQSEELGNQYPNGSVQIFENKGEVMGCSNPHPHGQIWAQRSVTSSLERELSCSALYAEENDMPLLFDYALEELRRNERVVFENDHFVVVAPYWAAWPFETLVLPRRQVSRLVLLNSTERAAFGNAIGRLSNIYDRLFETPFPYSSGIHQAPDNGEHDNSFTLHMHFYPPLLRSATVKKFMVGYEMLAEPQRDLTPEAAAKMLRGAAKSGGQLR